jgi:hypothetical protein
MRVVGCRSDLSGHRLLPSAEAGLPQAPVHHKSLGVLPLAAAPPLLLHLIPAGLLWPSHRAMRRMEMPPWRNPLISGSRWLAAVLKVPFDLGTGSRCRLEGGE